LYIPEEEKKEVGENCSLGDEKKVFSGRTQSEKVRIIYRPEKRVPCLADCYVTSEES